MRRISLWAALALIVLLTVLAVVGAFAGAARAEAFFNSLPLAVYWVALGLALAAGIVMIPRVRRCPGLLLVHAGCALVLGAAAWGSEAGHRLQHRLFGTARIRRAEMVVLEGTREDHVRLPDGQFKALPFALALDAFRIETVQPGVLLIATPGARGSTPLHRLPAEPGRVCDLGRGLGRIAVVRTFEHFRIAMDPNRPAAYEDPNGTSNPAVEVRIVQPDGTTQRQFVFERFPDQHGSRSDLTMSYQRMVKDYISQIKVMAGGRVVAEKAVEVNRPLHFGGYAFYQSSYGLDPETRKFYTVLTVVCDCGLSLVYLGYGALLVGLAWHLWGDRLNGQRTARVA